MRKRSVIFIIAALACCFSLLIGQNHGYPQGKIAMGEMGLDSTDECRKLCDRFIRLLCEESYDEAFAIIKPYWPVPENEMLMLQTQTITQLNIIAPRYGGITGYELVSENKAGNFSLRFIYAQKREKHMIRWTFIFYKPRNKWMVNAVSFDDNISKVFNK